MIIEQTRPLLWHVSDDDFTPVGTVDLEPDGRYVALQSAEIMGICDTLEDAAQTLFNTNNDKHI